MKRDPVRWLALFVIAAVGGICLGSGCGGYGPPAPENLVAVLGPFNVDLSWDAVSSAQSYNIYRANTPDVTKESELVASVVETQYPDTELSTGLTYYYRVAAATPDGSGELSNEVYAELKPAPAPGEWRGAWISATPQGNTLNAVFALSSDSAYAVGNRGSIIHYDGTSWSVMTTPVSVDLRAVWGLSDSNMYAVGDNGTILHYDGSSWSATILGSSSYDLLLSVWGAAENNVFVGGRSNNYHYDGTSWETFSGLPVHVMSLWGLGASNIYAGTFGDGIWNFNGSNWSQVYTPTEEELFVKNTSLWGSSANDVYSTAMDQLGYASGSNVYHYNGTSWSPYYDDNIIRILGMYGVWGSSANDVYIAGEESTIYHFNGQAWRFVQGHSGLHLNGLSGSAADNIFSVGQMGVIYHYDGTQTGVWDFMRSEVFTNLLDIWRVSDASIYFAGNGHIFHYDGAAFTDMAIPSNDYAYYSFWGPQGSATDIFAVGYYSDDDGGHHGSIIKYDGANWTSIVNDYAEGFAGIWGTDATHLYVISFSGNIYSFDGATLAPAASPTTNPLNAVWGTNGANIYAVGYHGTVVHYDGAAWSLVDLGTTNTLESVWGNAANNVYVSGGNGLLFHYDGSAWAQITTEPYSIGTTGTPNSIMHGWIAPSGEVFMTGDEGMVLHYDPSIPAMERLVNVSEFILYAVTGSDESDIIVSGAGGTALHYAKQ